MGPISAETKALVQRLNQRAGLWERLKGSRDEAALLSAIGESNEPAAIIDILPFALFDKVVANAAAVAVHQLALGITSREFTWFDCAVRRLSPYSGNNFYAWHKMSPDQLSLLERFGERSVSLLGMASFHQSGYIRQAAIKRLDLITNGAELPYLILRLNDWVSNVRYAAYEAIRSRLKPEYASSLIANLALVSRLEEAGRADHQELIHAINGLLQSDACRTALLESLKSDDRFTRRSGFRLALNSTGSDLPAVVRRALDDHDTVVRLWAAQAVSGMFSGAALDQLLEVMKRDRFMPVRREALRSHVYRNSPASLAELRSSLLDSHTSMRDEARYHLRKLYPMDVAAFYRQHWLAREGLTSYAVISGLGETGATADDHLIVPYTSHPDSRIRRAAIRALAKLNRGAHIDLFIEALKDQVAYVSRQALNALAYKASAVDGERVWELFQSAAHPHVKRNALSLFEKLGKWESIYYLVRAVRDSDEAIAGMSRFGIQRWLVRFNRSFSSPSAEQVAMLGSALEEGGYLLDDRTVEQLRFSVKGFNQM